MKFSTIFLLLFFQSYQATTRTVLKAFHALNGGKWVKFISGASNQDLVLIRNLSFIYTLAGVDCVDLSPDLAVIKACYEGITAAIDYRQNRIEKPLLMVSVNDFQDVHFRKASFNPETCPSDCKRPCERVCPANAIDVSNLKGVLTEKCYGCGRCIPICPYDLISEKSYQIQPKDIKYLISSGAIDAIEIHTNQNNEYYFSKLWLEIGEDVLSHLSILAISFPDMKESTYSYLNVLQKIISHTYPEKYKEFNGRQIWQADGKSMTGDIGKGTVHSSIKLADNLLSTTDSAIGLNVEDRFLHFDGRTHFLQLAGGTNDHSFSAAKESGLVDRIGFGGFGFGGYARKFILKRLDAFMQRDPAFRIENDPLELDICLNFAQQLVDGVKKV